MNSVRKEKYRQVLKRIEALIRGETDEIAVMATVACELHQAFDCFDWTGFYRVVAPGLLKVGPYQGTHGCLDIPFSRGICGAAARSRKTQLVKDVSKAPDHIACSATTRSEIVVPLVDSRGVVRAVLDIDSDTAGAFGAVDREYLEETASLVAGQVWK